MKNKNIPITHEGFPSFVKQLESAGTRLNGLKISRTFATALNTLMSCILVILAVSVLFCGIDDMEIGAEKVPISVEKVPTKEVFTHYIPAFFDEASLWVMKLLPDGLDQWWICFPLLLVMIPVTGLLSGLIFRWIPFKGKTVKIEVAGTREDEAQTATVLLTDLGKQLWNITCEVTTGTYFSAIVAGIAILALPIISLCRASSEISLISILFGNIFGFFSLIFVIFIALCLLCFAAFWLTEKQEWVTSLFYRSHDIKKYSALLSDYQTLLKNEAEENHKAQVLETESEVVDLLISGKISNALKLLDQLGNEAKDKHSIEKMAEALVVDKPDVWTWCGWLDWDIEKINSEKLRTFLCEQQEHSRNKLLELAEIEYPKALALLEKQDYEGARAYLKAADAVDYRDGIALFALSEFESGNTRVYSWVIERLNYGIKKGIESEKMDVKCRSALNSAETYQREENEQKAAAKRAEEAYWLEIGRQINMTCKYKQGDYCCRYSTLDNFPPLCFYRNNPRNMYMCDKRKT